jgi:hypothetical protein
VAGSVRARLLLERRAGPELALELAEAGSLADAVAHLQRSPARYSPRTARTVHLEQVQHDVASSVGLAARVLAAWLPREAAVGLRAMASWFELVNLEDRLAYLTGGELRPAFELGALSSVWEAAAEASSVDELRRLLSRSPWGDAGTDDPEEIALWLRFAWAKRVGKQVPAAEPWAAGAAALVLATEMFVAGRFFDAAVARELGLGSAWVSATSIADLRARLPARAAWALDGVEDPPGLFGAELAWWRRLGLDAERLVHGRLDDADVVIGALALLALDALRVNAALAVAARSGSSTAREVLDALC